MRTIRIEGLVAIVLVLLGGCAGGGAPSGSPAGPQSALELCLAYAPVPPQGKPDEPASLAQACPRYLASGAPQSQAASTKQLADFAATLDNQCHAAVPDDPDYCRRFVGERRAELDGLVRTSGGGTPLLLALELGKTCILLADHVFGSAPATGYCIDGRDGLFGVVQAGDPNRRSDLQDLMKRRFPLGTPAPAMLDTLRRADFDCATDGSDVCRGDTGLVGFADRRVRGVGALAWRVHWHADEAGKLDGLYVQVDGASL